MSNIDVDLGFGYNSLTSFDYLLLYMKFTNGNISGTHQIIEYDVFDLHFVLAASLCLGHQVRRYIPTQACK